MGIYTSLADEMVCPLCGDTNTHVDRVAMAARPKGEDGNIVELVVTANDRTSGPGNLCRNCWFRPATPGWATCTPCFFQPARWRVPCVCNPRGTCTNFTLSTGD